MEWNRKSSDKRLRQAMPDREVRNGIYNKKLNLFIMEETIQLGSYQEKLFDERWQAKRQAILERDNRRCVICGSKEKPVVHHKQYHFIRKLKKFSDPWDYDDKYLVTLCESCHSRGHRTYEIPVKNM